MVRVQQKARGRTTGTGGSSGLPCAMALRLIRDLPGDHAFLPPSPARRLRSVFTTLAPASERQNHTTSPSAQPPLVAQELRPAMCVHRIPCPTSVTIASRPSCGHETGESIVVICPTTQCRRPATDWHDGQFAHGVHVGALGHAGSAERIHFRPTSEQAFQSRRTRAPRDRCRELARMIDEELGRRTE
jgi:hypothetical protein